MSETPRVDAAAEDGWSGDAFCVSMDFARQLERELATWKSDAEIHAQNSADRESLRIALTQAQARCAEVEKLLGEARENLIWCGGSVDFGWGGKAQIGYDKGPRATIAAIDAALKEPR